MDDYNPDALDADNDEQDDDRGYESVKERIVVLVDAGQQMLRTHREDDDERTCLEWAVACVADVMKARIRASPHDEVALLFYGTREGKAQSELRQFAHVYEWCPLDVPSALQIRRLQGFDLADFEAKAGSRKPRKGKGNDTASAASADMEGEGGGGSDGGGAASTRAARDLMDGLLAAWDVFHHAQGGGGRKAQGSGGSRVAKTLLVFTNDDDPLRGCDAATAADYRAKLVKRLETFGNMATTVELLPLVALSDASAFDASRLWRELRDAARAAAAQQLGRDAGDDDAADVLDAMESGGGADGGADGAGGGLAAAVGAALTRVRDVTLAAAQRRKRATTSLELTLAPGLRIAVQLFALLQPARPHVGAVKYVTAGSNEAVVAQTALMDRDTAALVQRHQLRYKAFDVLHKATAEQKAALGGGAAGGAGQRPFPVVTCDADELRQLKALRPRGLALIGFKKLSALKPWHAMAPPRFVYPDERAARGSTAAFVALHTACLPGDGEPQIAVCRYVRTAGTAPLLAALVPQREIVDDAGRQVAPPGFHLVALPYRDDLRVVEAEAGARLGGGAHAAAGAAAADQQQQGGGGGVPRATPDQIEAAAALVGALSLDSELPFRSEDIGNPHAARFYDAVEALALGDEPPPVSELDDQTAPDVAGIDAHEGTMAAFKVAVWGSADGPPADARKPAAKRKAAASADAAEQYAQHDWRALAGSSGGGGGLQALTVDALKVYLAYHGLPKSGNKAALVARIQNHMEGGGGGA